MDSHQYTQQPSEEYDSSLVAVQQSQCNNMQLGDSSLQIAQRNPNSPALQFVNHESRVDCNIEHLLLENQELRLENVRLKERIEFLNTHFQRLDVTLLNDSQVNMCAGISCKLYDCIDNWLQPVASKQRGSETLHQCKSLLVLMRLQHNRTQDDLACYFNIEQSSVLQILN